MTLWVQSRPDAILSLICHDVHRSNAVATLPEIQTTYFDSWSKGMSEIKCTVASGAGSTQVHPHGNAIVSGGVHHAVYKVGEPSVSRTYFNGRALT